MSFVVEALDAFVEFVPKLMILEISYPIISYPMYKFYFTSTGSCFLVLPM